MKASLADQKSTFIDTPKGIFTASGRWFRTTEEALADYAGPLVDREPIPRLLENAELWLRSPGTIILWTTPFLLWYLGPIQTTLINIFLFVLFALWGPVLASHLVLPLLRLLEHVLVQALLYVISMSYFAMQGHFDLLAYGLVLFILVRWGLIEKAFDVVLDPLRARLYKVPYPDQVLKAVVIRAAMSHRVPLPELDRIEAFILKQLRRK